MGASILEGGRGADSSPLLTDLYQLSMVEAYLAEGETETAVFELFVRRLPTRRSFLMAGGLEQALEFLQNLHFSTDEIDWLERTQRFSSRTLDYLADLRFTGDVHALSEGTIFFANEPIVRVTAPLPEAQLVEARLINIVHFQTLIASKAARMVLAAPGKLLVDFGLRRAHGAEAGLMAARASYIAGFDGTATVLAAKQFDIPMFGTMAHSYIEAHDNEAVAFERFAQARPEGLIFLIDTYDTEAAAQKVVSLAPKLKAAGISVRGVRLDSGDLIALSESVRRILDEGELADVKIFASGGLDEDQLMAMGQAKAPIDGFGIGTSLTTSSDVPALDCAYKIQEYAGLPRRKYAEGKATWPGRKQVWRRYGPGGRMIGDTLSVESDHQLGEKLIRPFMHAGARVSASPTLGEIRAHAASELERLPAPLRELTPGATYPVELGGALLDLTAEFDHHFVDQERKS
jgi:nicotinate phosphoribosyltransferase